VLIKFTGDYDKINRIKKTYSPKTPRLNKNRRVFMIIQKSR